MIDFHNFKKIFTENIYSINKVVDIDIDKDYKLFNDYVTKSQKMAFSILSKEDGIKLSDDILNNALNVDGDFSNQYGGILVDAAISHLEGLYSNERLDGSGMCLITNLIGKACQMIHNEELLGVVRGYDKKNSRLLIVDFGGVDEEVKVDVDELRIQGQKK